ncbi:hypothetical protein L3X38_045492 [Prunus dulcis]|uniref:Uncharacterized protein n=1 Tax=Prunus dulcis TaxID=3755 RepID=A0AAD4UPT6_PRUDU|nr:hypothetical protein L3X38_045492 [Prunus dulcis]
MRLRPSQQAMPKINRHTPLIHMWSSKLLLVTNFGIGGSSAGATPVSQTSPAVSFSRLDPALRLKEGRYEPKAPQAQNSSTPLVNLGLRTQMTDYSPNHRDEIRRAYLQKGPYQPKGH